MQADGDLIDYLEMPKEFQASADQAKSAIENMVLRSDPAVDFERHDLPNDCLPVVNEVQTLYRTVSCFPLLHNLV